MAWESGELGANGCIAESLCDKQQPPLPSACPAHLCNRLEKGEGEVRMAPLMFANSFENRQLCICGKTVFILRKHPAASTFLPVFSGKCQLALLAHLPQGCLSSCKSCAEIPNRGHCTGLNAGIGPCQHRALGDAAQQEVGACGSRRCVHSIKQKVGERQAAKPGLRCTWRAFAAALKPAEPLSLSSVACRQSRAWRCHRNHHPAPKAGAGGAGSSQDSAPRRTKRG